MAITKILEGGGIFPMPNLVDKHATPKAIAFMKLKGDGSSTSVTLTDTDLASIGLASMDGVFHISSDTATDAVKVICAKGKTIECSAALSNNVVSTIAVIGNPREPIQE